MAKLHDINVLTPELRSAAVTLSGELAWQPSDARLVIECLARNGLAVVGIEIWIPTGSTPNVWGWSEYEIKYAGDWSLFVRENAAAALRELEKALPSGAVVNITWIAVAELQGTAPAS